MINRKKTLEVNVGGVIIGGNHNIVIQSMTNTPSADIEKTYTQIIELIDAGSELVRLTIDDDEAAIALPKIKTRLLENGYTAPLVGDFHFNGHILLNKYPDMAQALDKYRINPGNSGNNENFESFIKCAIKYDKPIRIGANGGSLDQALLNKNMEENNKLDNPRDAREVFIDSMIESVLMSIKQAEEIGLSKNKIVLSVKMSDIQEMVSVYTKLSEQTNCPIHLGLTEAGGMTKGIVASSAALAILLQNGIGDTFRVSITPEPGQPRSLEVQVCKYLLQTMGIRDFQPIITSCPGCGRTISTRFQSLAKQVSEEINIRLPQWRNKYKGFEKTKIAVMGCVVNGPGEAKSANIGIFFPGKNENPKIPVYIDGSPFTNLEEDNVFEDFMNIIEEYFQENFSK